MFLLSSILPAAVSYKHNSNGQFETLKFVFFVVDAAELMLSLPATFNSLPIESSDVSQDDFFIYGI
jgi:hypothetical protein